MKRIVALLMAIPVVVSITACRTEPAADLILHSGRILTVDPAFSVAEAVAVRGDRILAAGSTAEIERLGGRDTRRVDLGGKTVLPGLIDSHTHAAAASMFEFDHTVPDMETIDDVLRYVSTRAEALDDGQWVVVSQVFITRLRDKRYPTRAELDKAAPANPVAFRTGPDASLNSQALKLCGIDRNFKVTDGKPCRIERDPKTGEPTGILRSCARFIKAASPGRTPTTDDRLARLKEVLADYNSVGITGIVEGDLDDEELELYRTLKDRNELNCRTFVAMSVDAQESLDAIEKRIQKVAADPLHKPDNMLWVRGAKSYLDGGMLTGSAYMREPWGVSKVYAIDDPAYRGMLYIEPEKLYRIMKAALSNDLQFTAHSVGDGAVQAFIDAAERIDKSDFPVRDRRPVITHANFWTPEAIKQAARLGVLANMQPAWLWLDAGTLLGHFGADRTAFFQPYKTLFEDGAVAGGGSDHMQKIGSLRSINPYNPFLGIWTTLTRSGRWMDGALHPEQAISREQAIRLYTNNNAFLTFSEKEKGSIEKGKLADFAVLDRDILTCPVEEIRSITVDQTWLGGKLVYSKAGAPSSTPR